MKKRYALLIISSVISIGSKAQTTYSDVAGIFYKRCTSCHHVNGGAPFSMMKFSETAPYAAAIKNALLTGAMPPWHPDTTYGRYLYERIVTASEKNAIIKWIDNGAVEGNPALVPPAPIYTKYQIQAKPDLVLKIPNFKSNATSGDVYNCFLLKTGLTTTRYIRAFEIVPNNKNLVHHVVVSLDTVGNKTNNTSGSCFSQPGEKGVGGYTPGCAPSIYPNHPLLKAGMPIKPYWQIAMQQHYAPGTAGLVDSTEIRIYLYPEGETGIRQMYAATNVQYWCLPQVPCIPANKVTAFTGQSDPFPNAISLWGEYPHAHSVNKSMRINAIKPGSKLGTDSIKLIQIKNWDFDWEGVYVNKKMIKVPAGYMLHSKHVYDNTTNNPNNPNNPPQAIAFGYKTSDEMLFDSFEWLDYKTGDENLDIEDIMKNDPLIVTSVNELPAAESIKSHVYPNPASTVATLIITNVLAEKCELKLFDIYGNEVAMDFIRNADSFLIHKGDLSSGVYFYSLKSGNTAGSGKIVFMPNSKN